MVTHSYKHICYHISCWQHVLHGPFKRETKELSSESWCWIRAGEVKKQTEGLIFPAQDHEAPRTNSVKEKIEEQKVSPLCRMCTSHDETVQHILCGCLKLAQVEYKKKHDIVGRVVHWELCRKFRLECSDKWCEHTSRSVAENEEVKLLWDFKI